MSFIRRYSGENSLVKGNLSFMSVSRIFRVVNKHTVRSIRECDKEPSRTAPAKQPLEPLLAHHMDCGRSARYTQLGRTGAQVTRKNPSPLTVLTSEQTRVELPKSAVNKATRQTSQNPRDSRTAPVAPAPSTCRYNIS